MHNYKLNLEYNGANFHGSQTQRNLELRTVQGELEKVLSDYFQEEVSSIFAGRTDKGVHAIGQVVNFKVNSKLKDDYGKVLLRLNSHLAEDLVITKIEEVDENFNARFNAKSREYLYKFFVRRQRPVLRLDSLAWFKEELDFELMQAHCKNFLGTKDFRAYAKDDEENTVCEVYEAELIKESKICFKFRIKANRFLRHMVRRMVGELVHVGKGFCADEKSKAFSVAASGLTLMKIEY